MSIPWSRSLCAIAMISLCSLAGCAGAGTQDRLESTPSAVEEEHRSSAVLSAEKSMQQQLAEKRASLAGLEYETNTFNNQNIYFAYDSSDISDEAARILTIKADTLKRHPQYTTVIEGHCDEWGTIEYNLALGDRRARSARDFLIGLGIEPERIQTVSYGEERPQEPGHNEEAWAKNRRAQFILVKP